MTLKTLEFTSSKYKLVKPLYYWDQVVSEPKNKKQVNTLKSFILTKAKKISSVNACIRKFHILDNFRTASLICDALVLIKSLKI